MQLCTGDQPFEGQESAWRTFREQLETAKVTVSELNGADEIEWTVDTKNWPITPSIPGSHFASVRIDGRPASTDDIKRILEVHHVRADETLVDMLKRQSGAAKSLLDAWLNSSAQDRRQNLDEALKAVQDQINACSPAQLPDELRKSLNAEDAFRQAEDRTKNLAARVLLLQKAVSAFDKLDQVRGRGPEMDAKLISTKTEITELQAKKSKLDDDIAKASEREHLNTKAEKDFILAQKHLVRQERNLREAQEQLAKVCSKAQVGSDDPAIQRARVAAGKRLNELLAMQPQIDAAPLVIDLLNELVSQLEEAINSELGGQTLVEPEQSRTGFTVSELAEMLRSQLAVLARRSPDEESVKLNQLIGEARSRLLSLSEIKSLFEKTLIQQTSRDSAVERLRQATDDLPPTTAQTLNELLSLRNELDAQLVNLKLQEKSMQQARDLLGGGQTEEALTAEVVSVSDATGIPTSRLRGQLDKVSRELEETKRRQEVAIENARLAKRVAEDRTAQVTRVTAELSSRGDLAWLRNSIHGMAEINSWEPDSQALKLVEIDNLVSRARSRLEIAVKSVQGISGALSNVVQILDSGPAVTGTWNESVRAWLSREVDRWFDDDQVRQALFEGGNEVRLDPHTMTVSWIASDGSPCTRPLSAFSSGQQALAFTRARIAQLEREPAVAGNRLIALDEFGSVMDRDNMAHLAGLLTEHASKRPYDQVVVILPLRENLLGESRDGVSMKRIESLRQRGYFAEPLRR
jgi:hypothetical protein